MQGRGREGALKMGTKTNRRKSSLCSRFSYSRFSNRTGFFSFKFCHFLFCFCDNLSLNFQCFPSKFSKVVLSMLFCRSSCTFTLISASSFPITLSDFDKSKRTSFSSVSDKTLFYLIEKSSEIGTNAGFF